MTAPVSPCVPLSASRYSIPFPLIKEIFFSSQSEGWKYNSQRLLFKLKAHRLGYIAGFSHTSSTSSSTDSAWKSLDSQTWRHSLDDKEITLRGAQLETICDTERHALQVIAMQRLAKTLPGISLKKGLRGEDDCDWKTNYRNITNPAKETEIHKREQDIDGRRRHTTAEWIQY